jgi:transposase
MMSVKQFVGLDVHKDTISIAVAPGGVGEKILDRGTIPNDWHRLVKRLTALGRPEDIFVAYEAGPTGYGLYRKLTEAGISCIVVAPSKTPRRPGDKVKTDRRDAMRLARYLRIGELVAVTPPDRELEALRDALRAREDAVRALRSARQQLSGFLLRHDRPWREKTTWGVKHLEWIRSQRFDSEVQRQVLEDYYQEVDRRTVRVKGWDQDVARFAEACPSGVDLYRALQALKGVSTIVAATLVAEIGDLRRFPSASHLMGFLGLAPSEHSSGSKMSRGAITKAGNTHVRYKLVQAAWNYRHRPAMTRSLKERQNGLPAAVCDIAWKAQKRLHRKYTTMSSRGKRQQVTVVAVARELCGFIWAIGQGSLARERVIAN